MQKSSVDPFPFSYRNITALPYPSEKAIYKEFEGEFMPIPIGYDGYLRMAFGDYMQLPPKEKQIPEHNVVYCDLENSYKKYKGKYYCIENKK